MYNMQLWETSGHAANYKENMFVFEVSKSIDATAEYEVSENLLYTCQIRW
jgi:threonyl-tRNA synthetase